MFLTLHPPASSAGHHLEKDRRAQPQHPQCAKWVEMACAAIKQLKGPVSDQEKLLVYSYYKQATQGDCNIPAPPATDYYRKPRPSGSME